MWHGTGVCRWAGEGKGRPWAVMGGPICRGDMQPLSTHTCGSARFQA